MDDPPTGEQDGLIDVECRTQEVADLIKGAAEAMSRIEIPEAAHRPVAPLYPSVTLFDYVVFILAGAVLDVRAEFVGNGPGVAGVTVGGDLPGLDLGDRPGGAKEILGRSHVAGFTEIDVDQIAVAIDRPLEIAPLPGDFEIRLILSANHLS